MFISHFFLFPTPKTWRYTKNSKNLESTGLSKVFITFFFYSEAGQRGVFLSQWNLCSQARPQSVGGWKIMYLTPLSIEDVEDVWIFGLMVAAFLSIGSGEYVGLQLNKKSAGSCSDHVETASSVCWVMAVNIQTETLVRMNCKLDAILTGDCRRGS